MEDESNSMQPLCRAGCGFFGNPATEGLCSVCYKESLKKKQQQVVNNAPTSTTTTVPNPQQSPNNSAAAVVAAATDNTTKPAVQNLRQDPGNQPDINADISAEISKAATAETSSDFTTAGPSTSTQQTGNNDENPDNDEDKDAKKKKNRCAECRRKVGLTGFQCRCGKLFCALHRYADRHNCTFDYREHGAEEIRRNNPVVIGEKIKKI